MAATSGRGKATPTPKPKQEYSYSVMAVHPVTGKDIPRAVFDDESDAHKDAAQRNKDHSQYSHHVKRIKKGNPSAANQGT